MLGGNLDEPSLRVNPGLGETLYQVDLVADIEDL